MEFFFLDFADFTISSFLSHQTRNKCKRLYDFSAYHALSTGEREHLRLTCWLSSMIIGIIFSPSLSSKINGSRASLRATHYGMEHSLAQCPDSSQSFV